MRKKIIAALTIGALCAGITTTAKASGATKSCLTSECSAGDIAMTYATKDEPFYSCPTKELSDYSNFVLGLVAMDISFGQKMRNISPETGEPEFLDDANGPNKMRLFLSALRKDANVKTFDQAVAQCSQGKNKVRVSLMNVPAKGSSMSIWAMNTKTKQSFWLPASHLDK